MMKGTSQGKYDTLLRLVIEKVFLVCLGLSLVRLLVSVIQSLSKSLVKSYEWAVWLEDLLLRVSFFFTMKGYTLLQKIWWGYLWTELWRILTECSGYMLLWMSLYTLQWVMSFLDSLVCVDVFYYLVGRVCFGGSCFTLS